ncbi:hypothetical protein MC885_020266, partial [Smutsia gigantea]
MPSSLCPRGQKRTAGRWDRPGPRVPRVPGWGIQGAEASKTSRLQARRVLRPSLSSPPSVGKGLCDDITAETRGLPAPGPGTPERRLTGVARMDNALQVSPHPDMAVILWMTELSEKKEKIASCL